MWQASHVWDFLKSKTSFCVTGARHRTLSHPHGRRGTFCALLKLWQACIKMRGVFGSHFSVQAQYLVNLGDVLKGSKIAFFVELSSNLIWDMMMIPCGRRRTSDASGSFFVAGAVSLCRPRQKKAPETYVDKTSLLSFSMFIFRGARNVL